MMEQQENEDMRESVNDGNNGERYTQVDNDIAFNPIEGFEQKEEKKEEENEGENPEKEKENKPEEKKAKKVFKKLKIILLGEVGVGKSSLINRYVNNKFNSFSRFSIGEDAKIKKVELDNTQAAELQIYDPENEEKLGKFTKNYFTDAHGALIVFDLTKKESFDKVKYWLVELDSNAPKDIVYCLLGNKADLTADRVVSLEDITTLAGDNLHYEVSAKTGNNVSLAFEQLTYGILEKQKDEEKNPEKVVRGKEGRKTAGLNEINEEAKGKRKCC